MAYNSIPTTNTQKNNTQQNNMFVSLFQQPPQFTFLQQSPLETQLKLEIEKYFPNVNVYLENEIIQKFALYMTGINLCIVCEDVLIAISLQQSDKNNDIKNFTHFVFCASHITKTNPHFKLHMISALKTEPTKNIIDLFEHYKIYPIMSNDQNILISNILHMINNMLPSQNIKMEIC